MRYPSRTVLISTLLIAASLAFHDPLRRGAFIIFRLPFTATRTLLAVLVTLPRLPSLTQENASLRSEVIARQLENAQLREALRQAQQANALAHLSSGWGIVARVIGRSTIPMQHTVLLDQGAQQGLTLDTVVVDASGLIGRVMEVHPATALVMLLTDPDSRVAGLVERSRETGLVVGRGGGQCELIYLDVQADLQEGDRVVTAGLGGPFPKGLLLGTVVQVFRDEASGTAQASVQPAASLSRLEDVLCLPAGGS